MELRAKYTLIAEGARGSLAKQLIARFGLDAGREPQKYGIGIKELWQVDAGAAPAAAWCSTPSAGRSTTAPAAARSSITSTTTWCRSASSSTSTTRTRTCRRSRNSSASRRIRRSRRSFEGGKRLAYGARAITEGGWQSVPKLTFPGGALVGCAAGFVNVPRIKGSHNAILSGMLAAEHVAAAIAAGRAHDELAGYEDGWRASAIGRDLRPVRNVKPLWSKFGTFGGIVLGGLDMWTNTLGFSLFGTLRHGGPDHAATKPAAATRADRLSEAATARSPSTGCRRCSCRTRCTRRTSRSISASRDMALQKSSEHDVYGGPSARYCPAAVYEWVEEARRPALRHQRGELRPLQDLRHQGPQPEHRLGAAGRRRRAELSEHVSAVSAGRIGGEASARPPPRMARTMRRRKTTVAGRIRRSPTSAATSVKALSQPNSCSDGRSEKIVTARPQASTSEVRISAGPTSTVARFTPSAGSSSGPVLQSQPVEEMDGRVEAEAEGDGQRDDAGELQALVEHTRARAPATTIGNRPGRMATAMTSSERKAMPMSRATAIISQVRLSAS